MAAGAVCRDGEWQNDDALALWRAGLPGLSYAEVNPYCLEEPVSPHLAAAATGVELSAARLVEHLPALRRVAEFVVVEGAGGWRVPLGPDLDIAGLAGRLDLPVLLVVGLRLGCLNHAQLSEAVIRADGARLVGWVATQVDPDMRRVGENLDTLHARLHAPCLGVLPHPAAPASAGLARPLDLAAVWRR